MKGARGRKGYSDKKERGERERETQTQTSSH